MKRVLLPLSAALLATQVYAEAKPGSVTINPFYGYSVQDSKRQLNDNATYGLNLEYRLTENWAAQAYWAQTETEGRGDNWGSDRYYDYQQYGFNALYYFMPTSSLQPYVQFGAGNAEYEGLGYRGDNETQLNVGAGVRYFITDALSVNGALIAFHSTDDDLDDGLVQLGVAYSFGGKSKKVEPAPAPVAAPVDSDGDGVPDSADKCPGTPAGAVVDANGCELDSDGDGVVDRLDLCPGTPAGVPVDETGCNFKEVTMKMNILFATSSAEITETYQPEVQKVADFLKKYPKVAIDVEGHTDSTGRAAFNRQLSQKRADSVKAALVTRYGISANRINAVGYGPDKPVADNSTAAGRDQNRRVVAVITTTVKE